MKKFLPLLGGLFRHGLTIAAGAFAGSHPEWAAVAGAIGVALSANKNRPRPVRPERIIPPAR